MSIDVEFALLGEEFDVNALTHIFPRLAQGLAVFSLPLAHQRRLRTSNSIERVNQELKRRTRVASLFPNEASLLRLISALLSEISDEWATSKIYLNMIPPDLPQI